MAEAEPEAKRRRKLKCPQLDAELAQWVQECNSKQVPINCEIIKNRGLLMVEKFD